jgi:mono/diheme cytochrome c family protein
LFKIVLLPLLLCTTTLYAQSSTSPKEDFIAPKEYGAMLYKNPRGISCYSCHGKNGEGKLLYAYLHRKKEHSIHAPNIENITYQRLSHALKKRRGIMPRYTLTTEEINALVTFLRSSKQE